MFNFNAFPRRYCIFSGTGTPSEWFKAILSLLFCRNHRNISIIHQYENKFSFLVGAKKAFSFGSGRMALYSILSALDFEEGDEIIVPAFTCVVVPNALLYKNIRPVYVDIDINTFNLDVTKIESAITSRTRAIYAQHTFGLPCNMHQIKRLANQYSLHIIEDAAHALGGSYLENADSPIGSDKSIVATFYTSDHSKVINTYLGGMVTSSNSDFIDKMNSFYESVPYLPDRAVKRILLSYIVESIYTLPFLYPLGRYIHAFFCRFKLTYSFRDEELLQKPTLYPYPCRLSSSQSLIGISQLSNLKKNIKHRASIAQELNSFCHLYSDTLFSSSNITWLRYSFLVPSRESFIKRHKSRYDLGIWFTSIFGGREVDLHLLHYLAGSCPVAEYVADHIVNVPTHHHISISDLRSFANDFR